MDGITKTQFLNMTTKNGITSSFEELDINGDDIISETDLSAATDNTVKTAIQSILAQSNDVEETSEDFSLDDINNALKSGTNINTTQTTSNEADIFKFIGLDSGIKMENIKTNKKTNRITSFCADDVTYKVFYNDDKISSVLGTNSAHKTVYNKRYSEKLDRYEIKQYTYELGTTKTSLSKSYEDANGNVIYSETRSYIDENGNVSNYVQSVTVKGENPKKTNGYTPKTLIFGEISKNTVGIGGRQTITMNSTDTYTITKGCSKLNETIITITKADGTKEEQIYVDGNIVDRAEYEQQVKDLAKTSETVDTEKILAVKNLIAQYLNLESTSEITNYKHGDFSIGDLKYKVLYSGSGDNRRITSIKATNSCGKIVYSKKYNKDLDCYEEHKYTYEKGIIKTDETQNFIDKNGNITFSETRNYIDQNGNACLVPQERTVQGTYPKNNSSGNLGSVISGGITLYGNTITTDSQSSYTLKKNTDGTATTVTITKPDGTTSVNTYFQSGLVLNESALQTANKQKEAIADALGIAISKLNNANIDTNGNIVSFGAYSNIKFDSNGKLISIDETEYESIPDTCDFKPIGTKTITFW